jgi:cyclic beta-1,2-glucan synthetase
MKLLAPPFDSDSKPNPGYISSYPKGLRENGAQYTHGSLWFIKALLETGQADKAYSILSMILPINHGRTSYEIGRYKTEPYVVSADVYSEGRNAGRGGWSWYTGAAAWMYRIILEDLLGVKRKGDTLEISPNLPEHWNGFTINYKFGSSIYRIRVKNHSKTSIKLVDDGKVKEITV